MYVPGDPHGVMAAPAEVEGLARGHQGQGHLAHGGAVADEAHGPGEQGAAAEVLLAGTQIELRATLGQRHPAALGGGGERLQGQGDRAAIGAQIRGLGRVVHPHLAAVVHAEAFRAFDGVSLAGELNRLVPGLDDDGAARLGGEKVVAEARRRGALAEPGGGEARRRGEPVLARGGPGLGAARPHHLISQQRRAVGRAPQRAGHDVADRELTRTPAEHTQAKARPKAAATAKRGLDAALGLGQGAQRVFFFVGLGLGLEA